MNHSRFWEIDFIRGIAIIMMIIYHFIFDLNYFKFINVSMSSGFLGIFQKIIAISFITLVGISLTLASSKKNLSGIIKKGLLILGLGFVITIITLIFVQDSPVYFGILHLIGTSVVLSVIFLKSFKLNIILGILSIFIGNILSKIIINFPWFLPFGVKYKGFSSLDYFPLFPWFGFVLIGIFIGKILYKNNQRNFSIVEEPINLRLIELLGKKSLLIYMIHQPIIISILYLIKLIK